VSFGLLKEMLKLPAGDRAELAIVLWESLSEAERQGQFPLTEADKAELDHRWGEQVANPASSVPWSELRSRLLG
jgi:putative addiction module component (TIGR02574 family)